MTEISSTPLITKQEPSRTALGAAAYRAAHQILDGGEIFYDPFACAIINANPKAIAAGRDAADPHRLMREYVCTRARFQEDAIADAFAMGARQCVILGAGLDTFAYRSPFGRRLQVWEVDQPHCVAWKLEQLARIGIAVPTWLRHVGLDFETDSLLTTLLRAGFDPRLPSVFLLCGVVPYITPARVQETLDTLGRLPGGAALVFDYIKPISSVPPERQPLMAQYAANCAGLGEPWLTYLLPEEVAQSLRAAGFVAVEDFGPDEMTQLYSRADGERYGDTGARVLRATTAALAGRAATGEEMPPAAAQTYASMSAS